MTAGMVAWHRSLEIFQVGAPSGAGVRDRLVRRLFDAWNRGEPGGLLEIVSGPLGRPVLMVDGRPGPSVSFSRAGDWTFAALGCQGGVGIDAARPEEFEGNYPLARAFTDRERLYMRLSGLPVCRAAAMLWAAKEAAVKAQGVGFHYFGPREVEVEPPAPCGSGRRFRTVGAAETVGRIETTGPFFVAVARGGSEAAA